MTRKRSNYRPRHIHADPLRVARNQATTLTDAELAQISRPIHAAFDALRRGAATQDHWCVLAGALHMAQNIERQGVVRGLSHHLQAADAALVAVEQRATAAGPWRTPTLYADRDVSVEIDDGAVFPPELCNEPRPPSPSKSLIKAAIERGEPIAGARIVRRDRLTVK